jgi:uncharacterized Ntn-hydrolase superfamily protein
MRRSRFAVATIALFATARVGSTQEPVAWRDGPVFHTFSIAAVDPRTGEVGVAVTTRVPCVGNGVPWVRKGVGAVATQASTRTEYGTELLDALSRGEAPDAALKRLLAADSGAQQRQIGVIALDGRSAQHTGTGPNAWAGHRAGRNYVTQGNILVGPQVIEAVARAFEASEGAPQHLADRLITALNAGFELGGDKRHGLRTSAAVVVADPRQGMSRRTDGQTVNINICEHEQPLAELRRVYDAVSQTLGYRTLQQYAGGDVFQLKVMLNALGYFMPGETLTPRMPDANLYTTEVVAAVDRFRTSEGMSTPRIGGSPAGLVDAETVQRLWAALAKAGKDTTVRQQMLDITMIRR